MVRAKTNLEFIFLEFGVRHYFNVGYPRLGVCAEQAKTISRWCWQIDEVISGGGADGLVVGRW